MVHELIGIHNGRVNLSLVPDIRPELAVGTGAGLSVTEFLMSFVGGHTVDKHGLFLPSTPPRHVWGPRNAPQDIRPDVPIKNPGSHSIEYPIHRGHETVRRRVP